MATIKTEGLDVLAKELQTLSKDIADINSLALYDGAGVVADEMAAALRSLPVRGDKEFATSKWKLYGATESEKEQLIAAFGISTFRRGFGSIETSVGFTGYVNTPSTRFNDMVPAGMLMQCIEYGTAFRQGTHTISAAIKTCKSKAEQAIQERLDKEVEKITT